MISSLFTPNIILYIIIFLLILPIPTLSGWVDPATPPNFLKIKSFVSPTSTYNLVMSDEFETSGRTFTDGGDNGWTAMDKSDDDMSSSGGGSLHFYNSTQVTTSGGFLNVSTEIGETSWTGYDPFKEEYVSMKVRAGGQEGRKSKATTANLDDPP